MASCPARPCTRAARFRPYIIPKAFVFGAAFTMAFVHTQSLKGHKSRVLCLAFSPSGKFLISGDEGGVATVWEVDTGEMVQEYNVPGHVTALHWDGFHRIWVGDNGGGDQVTLMENRMVHEQSFQGVVPTSHSSTGRAKTYQDSPHDRRCNVNSGRLQSGHCCLGHW